MEHRQNNRTLYKYVSADVCIKILNNLQLQWMSPLSFNDPFDVKREIDYGFDHEEIRQPLVDEFTKIIMDPDNHPLLATSIFGQIISYYRQVMSNDQKRELLGMMDDLVDQGMIRVKQDMRSGTKQWRATLPILRILCLSEVPDSTPMWAHYSDEHRGAAIGLKGVAEIDSVFLAATPIVYEEPGKFLFTKEDWVRHLTGQIPLLSNISEHMLYRKGMEWSYEKEWRLILKAEKGNQSDRSLFPIEPCEIESVIIGSRMPIDKVTVIRNIVRYYLPHVKLFKAVPDIFKKVMVVKPIDE